MKLRNKKTGKVEKVCLAKSGNQIAVVVEDMPLCGNSVLGHYDSLAELCEEWEDYKTIEPLIKDEKVRKAVKAWADANDIDQKHYHDNNVKFDFLEHRFKWIETSIEFNDIKGLENLKDGWEYTIAELCGEGEE